LLEILTQDHNELEADAIPDMLALRVVENLSVVDYILPRFISGLLGSALDALALHEVEAAFGNCVVVTVFSAAHAVFKIVLLQE
jgi:hypothetical protein